MNESCSQSNGHQSGSPRFTFERSPWNASLGNDENNPLTFSPFQFDPKSRLLGLNFNSSPKERRADGGEGTGWEERGQLSLSPTETDRKFKPKLNPLVLQKKAERARLERPDRLDQSLPDAVFQNETFGRCGWMEDEAQKSSRFACESTVFESNLKSERPNSRRWAPDLRENSVIFSDSEDEDCKEGRKAGARRSYQELPIKKLVRMAPLCDFFIQYYNGGDNQPEFDFQSQSELEIIRGLLRQMGLKNAGTLPLDPQVLRMSLLTQWKATQRSRNLTVLVLRMAVKVLRIRFAFANNLTAAPLFDVKKRFSEHYFGDISSKIPGLCDMDLESHRVLARLNKDQVAALLSAPIFEPVFSRFVSEELKFFLNGYRTRKLTRIFSKMEEAFLSCRTDADALRQILEWVGSGKFAWVTATPAYLAAIAQARKK